MMWDLLSGDMPQTKMMTDRDESSLSSSSPPPSGSSSGEEEDYVSSPDSEGSEEATQSTSPPLHHKDSKSRVVDWNTLHFEHQRKMQSQSLLFPRFVFSFPSDLDWFRSPRLLGVDFEGCPPSLCQITCARGTLVGKVDDPLLRSILWDERHTHFVYGVHDLVMVANGVDLQLLCQKKLGRSQPPPLVESYNLFCADRYKDEVGGMKLSSSSFGRRGSSISSSQPPSLTCSKVRYVKDTSLHRRVNWAWSVKKQLLTDEMLEYASSDSLATLRLGMVVRRV